MKEFLDILKSRNEVLFYFGVVNALSAVIFLVLTQTSTIQVTGINAWWKPFKFASSTCLYAWAMAWYTYYLPFFNVKVFNWAIIVLLGFEVVYIALQAARGQLSHFNGTNAFYAGMYSLMALAATLVTLYTAYIALLFFRSQFPDLPPHYVWAIRLALLIFVIFSFEGFVMGSMMKHTIGGDDGGPGIPVVGWSTRYGDARISHFIGMHALQLIPILSFYVLRNVTATIVLSVVYFILACWTLLQAMAGRPLFGD